jgi:hypothetical protein
MGQRKKLHLTLDLTKNLFMKKGQVAIFIVVALLVVATIITLAIISSNRINAPSIEISPKEYIDSCVKDITKEAILRILENGGDAQPKNSSISYNGVRFTYLCYNSEYYESCINQQPMLIEHIEKEITDYISPEVKDCFSGLEKDLEEKGYDVTMGAVKIETNLQPKAAVISSKRKLSISKGEKKESFDDFETKISTPLYELSEIASEIVNQEASNCEFNTLSFMLMHPEYDLRKDLHEDSNIYTLKSLETGDFFKFAIRGCVMPPGI